MRRLFAVLAHGLRDISLALVALLENWYLVRRTYQRQLLGAGARATVECRG